MYRLVIYTAVITSIVFGKSYTIDNVEIQSIIGKDGVVQITEKRVFTFKGSFTYAYQVIDKKNFKEIFDIERQYWEDRADSNPDDWNMEE